MQNFPACKELKEMVEQQHIYNMVSEVTHVGLYSSFVTGTAKHIYVIFSILIIGSDRTTACL